MIKLLIAEDQEIIRQSLEIMLSNKPGIEIVGTVANGREVLKLIKKVIPDVILMDIRMPEMDAYSVLKL